MSDFKGTPGPWKVVDDHPDRAVLDIYNCDDGDTFVCVYTVDKFADHNANLIAAAPELLEALQLLVSRKPARCNTVEISLARAAIAKALGQ